MPNEPVEGHWAAGHLELLRGDGVKYLVDWNQVMTNFFKYILLLNQTNLSGQETWSVGPCTDGWEYDTENYHR